jgi:hypothetical protein
MRRLWIPITGVLALVAMLIFGIALVGQASSVRAAFPSQQNPPPGAKTGGDNPIDTFVNSFDCGMIDKLGIDRQMNMRASLITVSYKHMTLPTIA